MATKWTSPTWRMPEESNQSKFENYSLDFDGSSNHIETNLTKSGTIAISCWFYTEDSSTQMAFFGAGTTNPYQIRNFGLQNGEYVVGVYTKDLTPNFKGIRNDTTAGSASYTTGQWTHFVGIIEQLTSTNANYYLYENGVLKVQANDGYREQTTYPFFLGAMNNFGTATQKFNGKIDQLAVFDYVPSQNQVNYLYNSGTPQNPMAISGNAPVAYYPLGGSSTGDATASSPSTLTVPNDSVPSATVFDFESGDTTFIKAFNVPVTTFTECTFSAWVKFETVTGTYQYVMGMGSGPGNFMSISKDQNSGAWYTYDGTGSDYTASIPVANRWYHVVVTQTGTTRRFYIDRIEDTNSPFTVQALAIPHDNLTLGAYNQSSSATPSVLYKLDGQLSNTQVWNKSLSSAEITTLYNNGTPYTGTQPQAANLKAWYKMGIDTSTWESVNSNDWVLGDSSSNYLQNVRFSPGSKISFGDIITDGLSEFSVSLWYNRGDNIRVNPTEGIMLKSGVFALSLFRNDPAPLIAELTTVNGSVAIYTTNPSAILPNIWHMLTITYDGSNVNFYVNETAQGSTQSLTGGLVSNTSTIELDGGNFNSSSGGLYSPMMSNAIIWDKGLTSGEVSTLFNSGSPINELSSIPQSGNVKGWWKLNSTTISDSSGNSQSGTVSGTIALSNISVSTLNGISYGMTTANLVNSDLTRSIPYSSYSMYMTGGTDDTYFDLGTDIVIGTGGNTTYSWSIWVKPIYDSISDVVIFGDSGATDDGSLVLSYSGGNWSAKLEQTGTDLKSSTGAIVNDTWAHIVVVVDSTASTKKMYINGQEDTASGGTGAGPDGTIKNINSSNTSNQYTGYVSNWAFWNSSLSADSILSIYNGGAPNDLTNLNPTHWWSMSGDSYFNGSFWTCPDLIGSNNLTGVNDSGQELLGNGPGSTGNGTATGMNIPANLQGNAPNSTKNAFSINMAANDKTSSVPDISS